MGSFAEDTINGSELIHPPILTQVSGRSLGAGGQPGVKRIDLRPQQRLVRAPAHDRQVLMVGEGVLSLDALPGKGQRQILDFLMAGDVIPLSAIQFLPTISVRALTKATLVCTGDQDEDECSLRDLRNSRDQLQSQLQRAHLQQLLVGHMDAEARVASFVFAFALRVGIDAQTRSSLELPMSRDDMADYLAMNRDTLSRVMMRFETQSLIARLNRHAIRVLNFEGLRQLSPVASLIAAILGRHGKSGATA